MGRWPRRNDPGDEDLHLDEHSTTFSSLPSRACVHGGPSLSSSVAATKKKVPSLSFPFSPPIVSLLCFPRPLSFYFLPPLNLFFLSPSLFLSSVLSPLIVLERIHHDCPVNHAANRSPWRRYPPTNEDLFRLVETRENTDIPMSVFSRQVPRRVHRENREGKFPLAVSTSASPQMHFGHFDEKDTDLILHCMVFFASSPVVNHCTILILINQFCFQLSLLFIRL